MDNVKIKGIKKAVSESKRGWGNRQALFMRYSDDGEFEVDLMLHGNNAEFEYGDEVYGGWIAVGFKNAFEGFVGNKREHITMADIEDMVLEYDNLYMKYLQLDNKELEKTMRVNMVTMNEQLLDDEDIWDLKKRIAIAASILQYR